MFLLETKWAKLRQIPAWKTEVGNSRLNKGCAYIDSTVSIFCEDLVINLCRRSSNNGLRALLVHSFDAFQLTQCIRMGYMSRTPQGFDILLMCRMLNIVLCVLHVCLLWCFRLFPQHVTSIVNERINRKWRLLPCLNKKTLHTLRL